VKYYLPALLLLLAIGSIAGCGISEAPLHGSPYQNPGPAPDFTMPSTDGGEFTLSGEKGHVIMLYFGYTFCPDICPATLGQLRSVVSNANIDPALVRTVFVTVDPARDSLEVLTAYLGRFSSDFIGLRAEPEALDPILAAYGVYAAVDPDSDPEQYLMTHTARVFVIDKSGRLVTNYSFDTSSQDIKADLERLVEEQQ
jgi:protein SCO1/2